MTVIVGMNNTTYIHTDNMNIAIITHIKSAVSNMSVHMFNASSGINDNINIIVILNNIIKTHINNPVVDTNNIVNNMNTLGIINND